MWIKTGGFRTELRRAVAPSCGVGQDRQASDGDPMDRTESFLLTDLYQLAMMEAYLANGQTDTAVFEFFVRKLPDRHGFFLAAGLEQVLAFLEDLHVPEDDLAWLRESGRFGTAFLDHLAGFRFTGDVEAMPEGTAFFPDAPILRITAPLPEAQYVETRIINILHYQSLVASKAARMRLAAGGARLIDFGLRRAHGAEAGLFAARAAYIGGFDGTATVAAARRYGVPVYGTMAHSFVQAQDTEDAAFTRFAHARPEGLVLLIDTYDTEAAARQVTALAPRLRAEGIEVQAVRLDSGDLGALATSVRAILDGAGETEIGIIASGGLDEDRIAGLVAAGAPIDGYGVGSSLTTCSDAPVLDCAYKLQEYAGLARRKLSAGKSTWPGRKQVWRSHDPAGTMAGDVLSTAEDWQPGAPLLRPVMRGGTRCAPAEDLGAIRHRAAAEMDRLPARLRRMDAPADYTVEVATPLRDLAEAVIHRMEAAEGRKLR